MSPNKKLISIVVPVFNEEENLVNFRNRMMKAVEGQDYNIELILINDGSKDSSWKIISELSEHDDRVRGVCFSRNFGSYAAIEAGFKHAQGDAIMCISADLQDPPEIINEFMPKWEEGFQIVWGTRAGRDDPFLKSLYAKIFYKFVRKVAFEDFPEDGMDIGLFDRNIITEYLRYKDRNSIPFFTIFGMGYDQAQVDYRRVERQAGESGWPFWKRVKCAIDIAVAFSYLPLRMITFTGVVCALFSFSGGVFIIGQKMLFPEHTMPGWSSLIVLILLLGGLHMIFLGIIAEYLWRTSDRVKDWPVYLVQKRTGFPPVDRQ